MCPGCARKGQAGGLSGQMQASGLGPGRAAPVPALMVIRTRGGDSLEPLALLLQGEAFPELGPYRSDLLPVSDSHN